MSTTRNIEKEMAAAKSIQKWFRRLPFRIKTHDLINHHEQELKLNTVDLKERDEFVKLVKARQFNKIKQKNIAVLALSAFNANRISYEEVSTFLEIGQYVNYHGADNVNIHSFLDSNGNLTSAGQDFLKEEYNNLKKDGNRHFTPLPKGHLLDNYESFEALFLSALKNSSPISHLFYVIKDQSPDPCNEDKHIHYTYFELPPRRKDDVPLLYTFSFGAMDIIGKIFLNKTWCSKEYRVGPITIDDIDHAQQRRVRLASISTPEVPLPDEVHGGKVTHDAYTRHDEYHREQVSLIPISLFRALERVIFLTRDKTKIKWSKSVWQMVDRELLVITDEKISQESIFCTLFAKISSLATVGYGLFFTADKSNTSVEMWMMVMDMVDNPSLWKTQFGIDVNSSDLTYDRHIALYKNFKRNPSFESLTIEQKIFVLDQDLQIQQLYVLDLDYRWVGKRAKTETDQYSSRLKTIPEQGLSFRKVRKGETHEWHRNQIYLNYQSETFPKQYNESRAVSNLFPEKKTTNSRDDFPEKCY